MHYSVEEFRPANPSFMLEGVEYELSLITLHMDSKLTERFGRIESIYIEIKKEPFVLFEVIWMLLIDKKAFKTLANFTLNVRQQGTTADISKIFMGLIEEAMAKSAPLIKNRKRYDELRKINQINGSDKVCYGVYYDKIAKRYPYTVDAFYNLTLRQLHIMLNVIGDKSYEEVEMQAALLGKKLKPRIEPLDVTPEQDEQNDKDARDALAELEKEYQQGKSK